MTSATELTEADREAIREARDKSPANLQAQIASLTAEIERLRALVKDAYREGFESGLNSDLLKEVTPKQWYYSEALAALQPKKEGV